MTTPAWTKALKSSADPQRALHHLDLLAATDAAPVLSWASPEQARVLAALLSGSQALSNWLIAHPAAISSLTPEMLQHPRRAQGLRREANELITPPLEAADYSEA